jgi:hypothetical protein
MVGAINTPNHHHSRDPSFQHIAFNTRALDFTPRHKQEIKSSPKSKNHSKHLVTSERDFSCSFEFLSLGSLFFFPILVLKTFVIKARDTNCVVVLAGSK